MRFKVSNLPCIRFLGDNLIEVSFTTSETIVGEISGLSEKWKNKEILVTIEPYSEKRSLTQNSYMWVLLNQLAIKLGLSKNDVYKSYVKDYGTFEIIPIKNEAVERFSKNWSKNGLGWFVEDLGESKLNGFTKLVAYYGSSTYNSKEMARMLEAIVHDCEEQGIYTMTMKDVLKLKNENDGE